MGTRINPRTHSARTYTSRIPTKTKSNKKRLFFIFFTAFMFFFFACTYIASMLTPSIEVPTLKQGENINTLTSEDFKGRLDPRLRSIEDQEKVNPSVQVKSSSSNTTTDINAGTNANDINTGAVTDKTNTPAAGDKTVTGDKTQKGTSDIDAKTIEMNQNMDPYYYNQKSDNPSENDNQQANPFQTQPEANPQTQKQTETPNASAKKPVNKPAKKPLSATVVPSNNNLILRDKVKVDNNPPGSIQMNKVIIDGYSTPSEAKKVSEEIMNSNLNVTPFIKDNNGSYSLQVGSFSNKQKADELVGELNKKNIPARIIRE